MPRYKVVSVGSEPRAWPSQYGTMHGWKMELLGEDGITVTAEWSRKPESQPPKPDEVLTGNLTETQYGWKFKPEQAAGGGGGGYSGGGEDPKRSARIVRQHSQEMAIRIVDLALRLELVAPKDTKELFELLTHTADWFDKDAKAAGDAA